MGSYYSGNREPRPHRRPVTQNCPSINISMVQERGLLKPLQPDLNGWPLEWTPQPFGGYRPWFVCKKCKGKCRILYRVENLIACRECHNLGYLTEQKSGNDYTYFWAARVPAFYARMRSPILKNAVGALRIPPRPEGMSNETYERLASSFWYQYEKACQHQMKRLESLAVAALGSLAKSG